MREPADHPGVVAPPPLIYLGFLLAGWALERFRPTPFLPRALQVALATALAVAGLTLSALAIVQFRRAGTNVEPWKPSLVLVRAGPYRYSRNPMYVGLTLVSAAVAVAVDSAWMLGLLVPLLLVIRYGVIAREERYLESKFGEPYAKYAREVPRWFGRASRG